MKHKQYPQVTLIIIDGFGVATPTRGNAVALSTAPVLNRLVSTYPSFTLQASGPLVGLPWGEMGNSEVGHLNIGAGRIVGQDLPRITRAIQNASFFENPVFKEAFQIASSRGSNVHLVGLVSSGGVHGSDEHVYALLGFAAEQKFSNIFVHMITDGRDTTEKNAIDSVPKLEAKIATIGFGKIATITGRFYAMDRALHWNQTVETAKTLIQGSSNKFTTAKLAVEDYYAKGIYDEMIPPTNITTETGEPIGLIKENDVIIFTNFRADRAIQLVQVFTKSASVPTDILPTIPANLHCVTMTEYLADLPVAVAFPPAEIQNGLSEVISKSKLLQFHVAEGEKYAHVTSFFNGGESDAFTGEERVIVPSPKDNTSYQSTPEMSAVPITEKLVEAIQTNRYALLVANFANPDMVGHTGDLNATIKAIDCVDECVGRISEAVLAADGALIITADHGNSEQMIDPKTGNINKDHTTSPVPCIIIAKEFQKDPDPQRSLSTLASDLPIGVISDVAPAILELLGIPKPPEMNAVSVLSLYEAVYIKE